MAQVKAGSNYVYNPRNGGVYVASNDVMRVAGMIPFSPREDGEFCKDMLGSAATAVESSEASVPEEAEKPVAKPKVPVKAKVPYKEQVRLAAEALANKPERQIARPTMAPTDDPTK